jgi:tRNA G18 (ribose-2'-O)-methylase SpoU
VTALDDAAGFIEISDPNDARLDDFRDLMDADARPDRRGVVIAEGVNVVERLLRSTYPVRAVAGVPAKLAQLSVPLAAAGVPVYSIDKWTLSAIAGFRITRGVLASAGRPAPVPVADLLRSCDRFAVLESLNDFENLGALFRNAAAFGVEAVLLDPQCADPLYRRSVRVSMGHVLGVPFVQLPGSWPRSLDLLAEQGIARLAMTPRPDAQPLRSVVTPPRWALMLGAEGPGLSDGALARADVLVRIPMAPGVDSLNVATAAAVAFAHLS